MDNSYDDIDDVLENDLSDDPFNSNSDHNESGSIDNPGGLDDLEDFSDIDIDSSEDEDDSSDGSDLEGEGNGDEDEDELDDMEQD